MSFLLKSMGGGGGGRHLNNRNQKISGLWPDWIRNHSGVGPDWDRNHSVFLVLCENPNQSVVEWWQQQFRSTHDRCVCGGSGLRGEMVQCCVQMLVLVYPCGLNPCGSPKKRKFSAYSRTPLLG